ncbi:unnamed protein product [Phytophthora lilii]|uniref:Unnamed protein product n=1 Tax=Phytophthora lilii TaxID=2077276 RepID=A0A9W6WY93_9STRA|nr:unnamed protein product [Phytophthora lilii]
MTRNMSRPAPPPSVASSARAHEPALPPVDELFPRPDLEPRMKKHLVREANETSNALIKDTLAQDEPGSVLWRPAPRPRGAHGNIHVLRGAARDLSEAKDATCVRAVSDDVHASIEEFALLFKLDSSREAADHLLLFNADLVQHATLYTLVSPSGQQPRRYVGVKWALVASPSRFFRNRDFCYLECQKEFTDARGRRGWVRSLHSLKLPCCPSLEKEHGIVRASIYRSGLTAVETDEPGVLSVTYTVELDLKGRMALELLQPGFLAQRVAALATVDKLLQQQRLSSSPLLGDLDIPAKKRTRGSCNLCFREFASAGGLRDTLASITSMSTRSKRYVCRKCGEGVCRRCSDDWWLDVPVVGRTKVRICTVCSAEAKQSHITAHTTRAGTYPIRKCKEPTTEVEGVTHPGLLDPPPRQRSLSMLDRPSDAASFFAQQEEIKRDLELRATELSRRVQLWDEMQMYEGDSSLLPEEQRQAQKHFLREQREREMEKQEREKAQQHSSRIPSSRLVEKEEEKEEPEFEVDPQRQAAGSVSTSESEQPEHKRPIDRYPSFMSSELSSNQERSDTEGEDVIRLTAEAGARLSTDYRDSDLSDYEEHTIDGLGEIRTTTDLTRWWQDQQRASEAGDQPSVRPQPQANLSPVPSPRKDKRRVSDDREAQAKVQQQKQSQQQRASVAAAAAASRNAKQEMVDLYSHWKQESTNEIQHQRHNQTPEQRQQFQEFEEQARYQEEQARRRQQSLESPVRRTEPTKQRQPNASVLQQIQQRQKELEHLRRHRQQPRDDDPPSSGQFSIDSTSSIAAKERYLQQQRQQQLDLAAERQKKMRQRASKALDQTAGEDVELMETSQGEWVPINEARASKTTSDVASVASSPRRGPGFCDHCGSPEYMGDNGAVKPSCKCASVATPTKAVGAVLFDGKWISSPTPQESS